MVICIGAAHVDVALHLLAPVVRATSNPARRTVSVGGVACNVARTLGKLGSPVTLASAVGDDPEGASVVAAAAADGVDVSAVARFEGVPTGAYVAVVDADGELVLGVIAGGIYDLLDESWADAVLRAAAGADLALVEANLPAPIIARIAAGLPEGTIVAADPVSVVKAPRLRPVLERIDVLFAGREEAALLADADGDTEALAGRLAMRGPGSVVVTEGRSGAVFADRSGRVRRHPAFPVSGVADVTGGGDGFVAGYLYGVLRGVEAPIDWGLAAAALAVESVTAVPSDLSADLLARRIAAGGPG